MSSSLQSKVLSSFAEAALSLDKDFTELDTLSGQLERLDLNSDSGLERAKEILAKFGECGSRIGDGVQKLAKELEEARVRAEKAASSVSARATEVQERQQAHDRLSEKFHTLTEMVRKVSTLIAELKKAEGQKMTDEEKTLVTQRLPEFESQLSLLVEEAQKLKNEAQEANMKTLVRNADSLSQTLLSAKRKISSLTPTLH
jgi:chromosome segregation ATPase